VPAPEHLVDQNGRFYRGSPSGGWFATVRVEREVFGEFQRMAAAGVPRLPVGSDQHGVPLYLDPRSLEAKIMLADALGQPSIPKMNGLAQTARVFGFLSLIAIPFTIPALICGYKALRQIEERNEDGTDEARTGIWLGWGVLGVWSFAMLVIGCNGGF
jgi:hypothetical protein